LKIVSIQADAVSVPQAKRVLWILTNS
jgi:hypothetical protein